MKENLKILLLNLVYQELNLQGIENELESAGVESKEITFDDVKIQHVSPKYFVLANDIHLENLNEEELKQLNNYMENYDENNIEFMRELYRYLSCIQYKILCQNIPDRYIYYGPVSMDNLCPSDAIVLQLHYVEFKDEDFDDDKHDDMERIISNTMNQIQEEVGPSHNMNVAVVKCNEVDFDIVDDFKMY